MLRSKQGFSPRMPHNQHITPAGKKNISRRLQFILFFSVFFILYGILNSYIFWRGWQAVPESSGLHLFYTILFLFLSLSFLAGRFLERIALSWISSSMVWIGSYWLPGPGLFFICLLFLFFFLIIYGV